MGGTYLVITGLCLLCLLVRTGYELLKQAGKLDPKNKLIFAVVFVAMCLMLASWPLLCPLDPWRIAVPGLARGIGIALLALAIALEIGGLVQLRGVENIDHLVTSGLFAKLRHPMYTGFILWIAGWIIFHGALASLIIGLVCAGNILFWRNLEEAALESHYGEVYRTYRRGTWF